MAKKKYSLDLFLGLFVEVITTVHVTMVQENIEGVSEKSKPLVVTGIFLGHDDGNIFIGDDEGKLTDSLTKSQVVNIGLVKTVDKFDDMLDSVEDRNSEFSN